MLLRDYCLKFKSGNALSKREAAAIGLPYGPASRKGWARNLKVGMRELSGDEVSALQAVARKARAAPTGKVTLNRKEPPASSATSDAFLQSYEWRRVRMEAIKKYGARCQCCGATPATGAVINVDHIKPRRIFPELALSLDNLQILCADCNHGKGNWDMTDWRKAEAK